MSRVEEAFEAYIAWQKTLYENGKTSGYAGSPGTFKEAWELGYCRAFREVIEALEDQGEGARKSLAAVNKLRYGHADPWGDDEEPEV